MRKFFLLLLLGGAISAAAQTAWALPWEGWVTCSQGFSQELKLGRQLFLNYESINAQNPPVEGLASDVLWIRTASGVLIGQINEYNGTYPDWKKASFEVPTSLVFTTQELMFTTEDLGPRTDPRWVFNGISSPIPEPATLLLLGSGLLALAGVRKKRSA